MRQHAGFDTFRDPGPDRLGFLPLILVREDQGALVKANTWISRIELEVEGGRLDGLLLFTVQAREAVGEVSAMRKSISFFANVLRTRLTD
jgi:hypothetical protein